MKQRDDRFDTLRGILIFFVVPGHIPGKRALHSAVTGMPMLEMFIHSFHMPAMVFISGYFSK
jgi:fucose 4-O-acetylase-like acetyltransferase